MEESAKIPQKGAAAAAAAKGEETEEEKMEKFFGIFRSIRAAKDRLRNLEAMQKKRKIQKAAWTPSFQPEDFSKEVYFKRRVVNWPHPTKMEREAKEEEEDATLDLKLSL
ncbi:hypothetical protein ACLOJK_032970 [Asimina triloba]